MQMLNLHKKLKFKIIIEELHFYKCSLFGGWLKEALNEFKRV